MGKLKMKSKKRKQLSDSEDDVDDAIPDALDAYGQRFMDMFEPTDMDIKRNQRGAGSSPSESSSTDSAIESDTSDSDSDAPSDAIAANRRGGGIVEHIFSKQNASALAEGRKNRIASHPKPLLEGLSPGPGSEDLSKLERKRFMSHRIDIVSGARPLPAAPKQKTAPNDEDGPLSRKDFAKLQREVQMFGATALDKKSKSQFNATMLQRLGAKKEKGPNIKASIGIGMAKKKAERDARALEEAIASGMVKKKGMGNKKRRDKKAGMDRGLAEDGGAFRDGVLRVKGSFAPKSRGGGRGGSSSGGGRKGPPKRT